MPQVPIPTAFGVVPQAPSGAAFDAPRVGVDPGAQAQQIGQVMGDAANMAGHIAQQMQDEQDEVRVTDALNQLKERELDATHGQNGFLALKGRQAMDRPDGKALSDEYLGYLKTDAERIEATLGTDRQKQAFRRAAAGSLTQIRGQAMQHMLAESRSYELSVSEGVVATATREVALSRNDPDAVASAIQRISGEVYRQAKLGGKAAEWQSAATRAYTSRALRMAGEAALDEGNIDFAAQWLDMHREQMEADDVLALTGKVGVAGNLRIGDDVTREVVGSMFKPDAAQGGGDLGFEALIHRESRGKQFGADGKPLTSSAGAVGIAQVMEGTGPEAAKLAGLKWDRDKWLHDEDYNKAIGRAYFNRQLRDFGDVEKAWAAYNAGPGALRKALSIAEAADGELRRDGKAPTGDWLRFMPKETRDYVAANRQYVQARGFASTEPTLAQAEERVLADPRIGDNPQRREAALRSAARQWKLQADARAQREDDALAGVLGVLANNGGDLAAVAPSLVSGIKPKDIPAVMSYAQNIAQGIKPKTDDAFFVELVTNPEKLAATNLAANQHRLSVNDLVQLQDRQDAIRKASAGDGQKLTTIQSADAMVKDWAKAAKITDVGVLTGIYSDAQSRITDYERATGKIAQGEDLRRVVAQSFLPVLVKQENRIFPGSSVVQEVRAQVQVPPDQVERIARILRRNGRPVTDANLRDQWIAEQQEGMRDGR